MTEQAGGPNLILNALAGEFTYQQESLDKTFDRVFQILVVLTTFLGVLAGFILQQGRSLALSFELAWITPFVLLLVFGLILWMYYVALDRLWICRVLSIRLNQIAGETVFLGHQPGMPSNTFFSSRRGNLKPRLLIPLLIGGAALLYIIIYVVCFQRVYAESHLSGTLFLAGYGVAFLLMLWSVSGLFSDLPELYKKLEKKVQDRKHISGTEEFQAAARSANPSSIVAHVLPRPLDLVLKGGYFWGGFLIALYTVNVSGSRLAIINALFRSSSDWPQITSVPHSTVFFYGLLVFIASEIGLQQAKLLWDDIRDADQDRQLPYNKTRAVASGLLSVRAAVINVLVRTALALAICSFLGGGVVVVILFAVLAHQAVYVLWAKQLGRRRPWMQLIVLSPNLALRFMTGVVAVTQQWSLSLFLLLFVMLCFFTVGGMAAAWKMEAQYFEKKLKRSSVRPQGKYFSIQGNSWQHIGLFAATTFGLLTLLLEVGAMSCQNAFIVRWYASCISSSPPHLTYIGLSQFGAPAAVALIIATTLVILLISHKILRACIQFAKELASRLVSRVTEPNIDSLINWILPIKQYVTYLSAAAVILLISVSIVYENAIVLLVSFVALCLFFFLQYEGMVYPEQSLDEIIREMRILTMRIYNYIFQPDALHK